MTLPLHQTDIVVYFEAFNYSTKKHTKKNDHKRHFMILCFFLNYGIGKNDMTQGLKICAL